MKKIPKQISIILKNSEEIILHLTDTYFLKESKIGKEIDLPGFSRIYKIIEILTKNLKNQRILLLHSGDFLFPSLLSNFFKGKQMIDILNRCGLNYCTLGNHDFDGGYDILKKRIAESKFKYIVTNLQAPRKISKKILHYDVWPETYPKIAILGIVGEMTKDRAVENKFKTKNQKDSLKSVISEIKQKFPGVKLLIVLSHMSDMEDLQLKKQLNSLWRNNSIILGGHDHSQLISFDKRFENCMLVKGQSNARTLQLISFDNKITLKTHDLKKNLIVLNSKDLGEFPKSNHIEKVIESWFKKLTKQNKLPRNKIIKKFSKGIVLDGTEVSLRKGTTNLGNFITDCLKNYTHADIAMINSGHFRGDRFYSEKIDVLDLLFTFVMEERENIMITQLTKKECLLFLNHAFSEVGKGRILQFSKNTQCVLKKIKSDEKVRVALISDMIYSNEDGFAKILAKNRKISIVKLRRTLEKDIVKDTNLIDAIIKTAHKVNYDPKVRKQIKVQNQ